LRRAGKKQQIGTRLIPKNPLASITVDIGISYSFYRMCFEHPFKLSIATPELDTTLFSFETNQEELLYLAWFTRLPPTKYKAALLSPVLCIRGAAPILLVASGLHSLSFLIDDLCFSIW